MASKDSWEVRVISERKGRFIDVFPSYESARNWADLVWDTYEMDAALGDTYETRRVI